MINEVYAPAAKTQTVTRNGSYGTNLRESRQAESNEATNNLVTLLQEYRAHGKVRLQTERYALREKVYTALHQRLTSVCRRIANKATQGASEADVQDMAQEAVCKFWRQDVKGRGIFDPTIPMTPHWLNTNIKGNATQRYIDWLKRIPSHVVQCSFNDTPAKVTDEQHQNALEFDSALEIQSQVELRRDVHEVIAEVTHGRANGFTCAALEAALMKGRFNTAELGREHGMSQPTVWRETQQLRRRFARSLRRDGFGSRKRSEEAASILK